MKQLIAICLLLLASSALAQDVSPKDETPTPPHTITITITVDAELYDLLLTAAQWQTTQEQPQVLVANPAYDPKRPASTANNPQSVPTKNMAIQALVQRYLANVVGTFRVRQASEQAAEAAAAEIRDKLNGIKVE